MRRSDWLVVSAVLLVSSSQAIAEGNRFSQTGFPGALQTPTALMPVEGSIGFGYSAASPYNNLYLAAQPFSWLSVNARYTTITDRNYAETSRSYIDKGFDVAVQLVPEGLVWPSVSVGIIDLGGTGLFSSEYFVASQRFFDLYVSLGLGWGRMGSSADFENPLISISDSFRTREGFRGGFENTGKFSYKDWFRGEDVAVFGSLIWNPGRSPWTFTLELEGNDYSTDRAGRPIDAPSRVNVGVDYALTDYATLGVSYLRGNTPSFQFGLHPRIGFNSEPNIRPYLPELNHNRTPAYQTPISPDLALQLERLYEALRYDGFYVHAMDIDADGKVFTVWQSNSVLASQVYAQQHVGRHLSSYLPDSVETLRVVTMAGGIEAATVETPRSLIDAEASEQASLEELVLQSEYGPGHGWSLDGARYPDLLSYPTYAFGVNPALRSNIGGPGFYVGQFLLKPYMALQLTRSLSLNTSLGVSVVSDLDRVEDFNTGTLPQVRSDLEQYQIQSGDVYLEQMELNYFFPIASEWYGRVSAGIFEEMFGGVASEILYRPYDSRLAVSLDVNYVKKRDYNQGFDFRDYQVATGHLTFYYETPIKGVNIETSFGRYLARDVGATLDISRTFGNGARIGAFATKTDVSSKEFGEGAFDKGFYLYIPFSAFSKYLRVGGTSVNYRFLARDGGQKVEDGRSLYSVYGPHNLGAVHGR